MKKSVLAILSLILAFALLSCGAPAPETAPETAGVGSTIPDETAAQSESLPSSEEKTTEAETVIYHTVKILYIDEGGFAANASDIKTVYVSYPNAANEFTVDQQVRVYYLPSAFRPEKKTISLPYETYLFCSNVIDPVETVMPEMLVGKPMIYLYPEEETLCSVRVDFDGIFTCLYPEPGENGWENFSALPDGTLVFPDGSQYYALFWEGLGGYEPDLSRGFCVKGSETAAFLKETLPKLGLSFREAEEMIVYWLPKMQDNAYNLISFQAEAYTDHARLAVSPEPDTVIRVLMAYRALDEAVEIEPQEIVTPERRGFTLVEWGGTAV